MFDREAFDKLRSTREFSGFVRNCYLGFSCFYSSIVLAVIAVMRFCFSSFIPGDSWRKIYFCGLVLLFAGIASVVVITYISLRRGEPKICCFGEVISTEKKRAIIKAGDVEFRACSLETFLTNCDASDYKSGDKVIIYASSEKDRRPLFIHG